MKPAQIVSILEQGLPVGQPGDSARAVTGEPFISFAVGVLIPSGDEDEAYDDVLAQALLRMVVRHFATKLDLNAARSIYWRIKPEFEMKDRENAWATRKLRCRVLISDKPSLLMAEDVRAGEVWR